MKSEVKKESGVDAVDVSLTTSADKSDVVEGRKLNSSVMVICLVVTIFKGCGYDCETDRVGRGSANLPLHNVYIVLGTNGYVQADEMRKEGGRRPLSFSFC